MIKYTFPKALRLKSEKSITGLFEKGKSHTMAPLRLIWIIDKDSGTSLPKAGFSISKKNFKRAVDRNMLKRRMREAYRLNKEIIFNNSVQIPSGLEIMFLYTSNEIQAFQSIEASMIILLQILMKNIIKNKF